MCEEELSSTHTTEENCREVLSYTHNNLSSHLSNGRLLVASQPLEHATRLGNSTPSSHTYSTIKTELEKYSYKMITFKKTVLAQKGVIII